MSIEEKRRAAFEAHVRKTSQIDIDADGEDYVFQRNAVGYCRAWMAKEWRDWNAALDSVVIELPSLSRSQYANQHSFNCAAEALGCAKGAIESAGLKVKP